MPRVRRSPSWSARALAVAGVILQDLFLNPLTDPYVTGVSSGAALGATIAIVAGLAGGLVADRAGPRRRPRPRCCWSGRRRRRRGRIDVYVLLLAGVSASYLLSGDHHRAHDPRQRRPRRDPLLAAGQLLGARPGPTSRRPCSRVPFMIVPLFFTKEMNILLQGEKRALELGVDVERTKARAGGRRPRSSPAIAVSVSGIIAFVGLIVPHLVRLLVGPNHRRLLPFSLLMGAAAHGHRRPGQPHAARAHRDPGRRGDDVHRRAGVRLPAAAGGRRA